MTSAARRDRGWHRRGGIMSKSRGSPCPGSSTSSAMSTDSSDSGPETPSDSVNGDLSQKMSASKIRGSPTNVATPRQPQTVFLQEPFVHRQLIQGKWKTLVKCPIGVDSLEWIAVNILDFSKNINMVCEIVNSSGQCSTSSCPTMSIAPGGDCAWAGAQGSRAAPLFFDAVLTWVQKLIDDPTVFVTQAGRQLNDAFLSIAKRIWAVLADLWSHLYHAHYDLFLDLSLEAYTNSLVAHFAIFGLANELIAKTAPVFDSTQAKGHVLGSLMRAWSAQGIVPKDLRII